MFGNPIVYKVVYTCMLFLTTVANICQTINSKTLTRCVSIHRIDEKTSTLQLQDNVAMLDFIKLSSATCSLFSLYQFSFIEYIVP